MERYSEIISKDKREIVLLKGRPCIWGKCSFCDYIEDNSMNEEENIRINNEVLDQVTGKYKVLEVINSGSFFELPNETIERILKIIEEKKIERLFSIKTQLFLQALEQKRLFMEKIILLVSHSPIIIAHILL